jgi:hypothetical protein
MPIKGSFWRSEELQQLLGVSRQGVHKLSQIHGWSRPHPGLFADPDVSEYLWARARRQIMGTRELVWINERDLDSNCPECDGFALVWPDDAHYACVNGHAGVLRR